MHICNNNDLILFLNRFQSQSYGEKPMDLFQLDHIKNMAFWQSQMYNMQIVAFMFVKLKPMIDLRNELQLMLGVRNIDFNNNRIHYFNQY